MKKAIFVTKIHKMKKLSTLFLIFITITTFSQEKNNFFDKVQFGGGVSLGFSNNSSILGLSPSAVYNINDTFSTGLSVSYMYSKYKDNDPINAYGGSALVFANPMKEIQLSGEFKETFVTRAKQSTAVSALFLGAGYHYGNNVTIGVRYDVLYDEDTSLYPSALTPFARIYF